MRPPSTLSKAAWPPDYVSVWLWRQKQLLSIRHDSDMLIGAVEFYRHNPAAFINHWVDTYDPRNAGSGLPPRLPFILFPKQEELIEFLMACIEGRSSGLVEKCRDMGATWLCCAFSVWLWRYRTGAAIGWGSRKEQLVDKIGDPDSIFEKMRLIIMGMPREFWPRGFDPRAHMSYMKIINPANGATITGEAGDEIGRGGRKLIYFKDESAHYERPEKIEAALGDNTNTQIDISSVNGLGNVFHRKREAGVDWDKVQIHRNRTNVFVMDWRDHPAKDQKWYDERRSKAESEGLLHKFAQEVDRNYAASVEGVVIPAEWVQSAIGAAQRLGLDSSGRWCVGLDVADGGADRNAIAARKGISLQKIKVWGERDTGVTTRRAIAFCKPLGDCEMWYDSIGVGSGVKAEYNRLVEEGTQDEEFYIPEGLELYPWNAGSSVLNPEDHLEPDDENTPINKDYFANIKAQAWWSLRRRFEKTYRAVTEGIKYPEDELVDIDPDIEDLQALVKELSQPTMKLDGKMRLIIDKMPEGTKSPNRADAVVMAFFPATKESANAMMFLRAR